MSDLNGAYIKISHAGADIKGKVLESIQRNFAFLVLILNIAVTVAYRLFSPWVQNPFTPDFFITLATNILTTMFCYCVFISYGQRIEFQAMPGYRENCQRWSMLSSEVRQRSREFEAYCKERVEIEREERRRAIVENNTMRSYKEYLELYRDKTRAQIREAVIAGNLDRDTAHYVNRVNKRLRIKPINPLLILCGIKLSNVNDAGRDGLAPSTVSVISRPVTMFIVNAGVSMIHGSWTGVSTGEEIFDMIFAVVMIIMSSVMGYSSGVTSARKQHDRIKGRIYFLENFKKDKEKAPV